jgi:hypothetical protein
VESDLSEPAPADDLKGYLDSRVRNDKFTIFEPNKSALQEEINKGKSHEKCKIFLLKQSLSELSRTTEPGSSEAGARLFLTDVNGSVEYGIHLESDSDHQTK